MTPGPRSALRQMFTNGEFVIAPGAYDALSATLVERSGFTAAYMTGAGVSMSLVGYPDLGFTTMSEMAGQAARITACIEIPLIADADAGFGNALNVHRTVLDYQRAGVAAMHLEDQTSPKRCGHLEGKAVVDRSEFVEKLRAAVDARTDPDLTLIARTDARGPLGFDEAIARANLYAANGADMIFVEAPESIEEVERIPQVVDAPVMYNLVRRGRSPDVTIEQLRGWGYAMAIIPGALIAPVIKAITRALAAHGAPTPLEGQITTPAELFGTVGLDRWLAAAESYATE